ncbi:MAG TPA: hypothetical protein VGG33_24935 [Polyangia bacterium]
MTQFCRLPRAIDFVCASAALVVLSVACTPATVADPERAPGKSGGAGGNASGTISLPDGAAPGGDPAAPVCVEEVHKAEAVPVDLMLLLDVSGSMAEHVTPGTTKLALATEALSKFVRDGRSSSLGMGLVFFPELGPPPRGKACTADAECSDGTACIGLGYCIDDAGVPFASCRIGNVIPSVQCPPNGMCVPAGTCTGTRERCQNVGQPCPLNRGMCQPPSKNCSTPSGTFDHVARQCAVDAYETAAVPIQALPQNETALLNRLVAKIPTGGTPMYPAVQGTLQQLREHLAKNPGRRAVLLLATDGEPSCAPPGEAGDIPAIARIVAEARMGNPSIQTYVVGVFLPAEAAGAQVQLDTLAMAGSSRRAFIVEVNTDLATRLQEAFEEVRGSALSCEFKIPTHKSELDFGAVKVRFTTSAGGLEEIGRVPGMSSCDATRGGWYYDVDPASGRPTTIHVCPVSCDRYKRGAVGKVDLVFGCSPR